MKWSFCRARFEVLDDARFQQLLHGLAAVAGRDPIVVLVGDDGDVADSGRQLLGAQRLAAQQVCAKQMITSRAGTLGELAEAQQGVHLQELQRHGTSMLTPLTSWATQRTTARSSSTAGH